MHLFLEFERKQTMPQKLMVGGHNMGGEKKKKKKDITK